MSDGHHCRASPPQPPGSNPPRVAPHGKQGAHVVGLGLSIMSSNRGLQWIELGDCRRRSRQDNCAGKEVGREDKSMSRETDVSYVPTKGSSWATSCFSRFLHSHSTVYPRLHMVRKRSRGQHTER
ncbi:hypothetical protein PoB_007388500 [Plakobranchus ocellatus]|uniref:Uncharacterized protein n=1 Tax=Plakobranchus ocellatus TaxID=259542 RepID=A0AAV4DTA5_9GAST|nr:hypothetical protein PoB_007388500 [Plakobranchus ocellatus]